MIIQRRRTPPLFLKVGEKVTITFYNTADDPRVANKTLTDKHQVSSVFLKDGTDVLAPKLIMKNINHKNYNYIYVDDFKRYYFIKNWGRDLGGNTVIDCAVDVLMSFLTDILNTDVIVFNEGSNAFCNKLIPDSRLPLQANYGSKTFKFVGGEMGNANQGTYSVVLSAFNGG